jgi:hypothetical protein
MRLKTRVRLLLVVSVAMLIAAAPPTVLADPPEAVSSFEYSSNMHPLGISERENTISPFTANSDLAFWGKVAVHGNYDGFRLVDITEPDNPVEILDYRECAGNQGDVIVWGNVLVRSWNSAAPTVPPFATCDGEEILPGVFGGWEGLHVFDISNPTDPDLVASIETECGSHTATGVPDLANNRLLVYNNPSSSLCPGIDIVEVPLDDPATSSYLRFEPAGRSCHDSGVILGDAMRAACAGGNGFTTWTLDPAEGGSLEDPLQTNSVVVPGVTIGHSAALQLGRRCPDLRSRARRGRTGPLPGDEQRDRQEPVLLRRRDRRPAGIGALPSTPDRRGELHLAQLQRRPNRPT